LIKILFEAGDAEGIASFLRFPLKSEGAGGAESINKPLTPNL
jgi:hypothetical protein